MEKSEQKLWAGSLILVVWFLIAVIIAIKLPTPVGLSIIGIGTFIVALFAGNILSKEHEFSTGEVRRAIAIASTVVFFGLFFLKSPGELKPIVDNFWKVYATIIGFYFGARVVEEEIDRRKPLKPIV
jgi:hypothetical protein